jgi:hypothetical protein
MWMKLFCTVFKIWMCWKHWQEIPTETGLKRQLYGSQIHSNAPSPCPNPMSPPTPSHDDCLVDASGVSGAPALACWVGAEQTSPSPINVFPALQKKKSSPSPICAMEDHAATSPGHLCRLDLGLLVSLNGSFTWVSFALNKLLHIHFGCHGSVFKKREKKWFHPDKILLTWLSTLYEP